MTDPRKALAVAAAATMIGWDIGGSDATAHWTQATKPVAPDPKKRAKVKAARKQRNRK